MDRIRTIEELNCCLKALEQRLANINGFGFGTVTTSGDLASVTDGQVKATSIVMLTYVGDTAAASLEPLGYVITAGTGFSISAPGAGSGRIVSYFIIY